MLYERNREDKEEGGSLVLTAQSVIALLTLVDALEFLEDDLELGLVHLRAGYSDVVAAHQRHMGGFREKFLLLISDGLGTR